MSLQPLINRIALHLAEQRARSFKSEVFTFSDDEAENEVVNVCQYRGDNGRMCAVGCLIPDDLYTPDIEGSASTDFFEGPPAGAIATAICAIAPDADVRHVQMATEISQLFHDGLRSQKSLLSAVNYEAYLWCKRRERQSGTTLFDWEVLGEDYKKLLVDFKDSPTSDFANEIARRLTYAVGVVIQWDDCGGKVEEVADGE